MRPTVVFLHQHIEVYLSSKLDHERERAVNTTADLLEFYLASLTVKVSGAWSSRGMVGVRNVTVDTGKC